MTMPKQSAAAFLAWKFDTRVLQRNITDGVITESEVSDFLAGLPDVGGKGQEFRTHRSDRLSSASDDRDE